MLHLVQPTVQRRTAIFKAVSEGEYEVVAIAIVGSTMNLLILVAFVGKSSQSL